MPFWLPVKKSVTAGDARTPPVPEAIRPGQRPDEYMEQEGQETQDLSNTSTLVKSEQAINADIADESDGIKEYEKQIQRFERKGDKKKADEIRKILAQEKQHKKMLEGMEKGVYLPVKKSHSDKDLFVVDTIAKKHKELGYDSENPPFLEASANYYGDAWAQVWSTGMDWNVYYYLLDNDHDEPRLIAYCKWVGDEPLKVLKGGPKEFDGKMKWPNRVWQDLVNKIVEEKTGKKLEKSFDNTPGLDKFPKIMAIDFDGTIVDNKFPDPGNVRNGVQKALQWYVENGGVIVIWSCRQGELEDQARQFLDNHKIPYHYFNQNASDVNFQTSRKIYADLYIDDRGYFPGWNQLLQDLQELKAKEIKKSLAESSDDAVVEKLAEAIHNMWCGWSVHAAEMVSKETRERWKKMWMAYSELPEIEKEKDRIEARGLLDIVNSGEVKKSLNTENLTQTVYDYLAKNYPKDTLEWVKQAKWRRATVPLSKIDMQRRPGGRNMAKVEAISKAVENGEKIEPIVLVKNEHGYRIADGYHRTLGFKHAGKTSIRAYVAEDVGEHGTWDREMHSKKLNKSQGIYLQLS